MRRHGTTRHTFFTTHEHAAPVSTGLCPAWSASFQQTSLDGMGGQRHVNGKKGTQRGHNCTEGRDTGRAVAIG